MSTKKKLTINDVKLMKIEEEEKYWDVKRAGRGYILTPIYLGRKTLMTPTKN